jgi:hypothetical protein
MNALSRFGFLRAAPILAFLSTALLALNGCATSRNEANSARPGAGLAEYTQLVQRARQAVESSMQALDKLNSQSAPCPPAVVSAFSAEVDRLASESIEVRARADVLQARGDAYFENWHENMARLADPALRESAERHRSELQQSFARIRQTSQQTRSAFRSYLAGLRQLRSSLEKDPNATAAEPTKELARSTRESGFDVEQGLKAIGQELKAMTTMLSPTSDAVRN